MSISRESATESASMTHRERYRRVALYQKADRIPNMEGIDGKNLARWRAQGMPADAACDEYFGLDFKPMVFRGLDFGPRPGVPNFNRDVPDLGPEYDVGRDRWGRVGAWHRHSKDDPDEAWAEGAFEVIEGALQTPEQWRVIRDHFQPDVDGRYPADWPEQAARLNATEQVRVLEGPSMIGELRMELGFENYCMKLHDDPGMIAELLDKRVAIAEAIMGRALDEVAFDMLWFWEDCAYRNGPILSPAHFEALCVPRYRRLADWYRARGGEIVAVDSDGDIRKLVPGWIAGGINHIWPLEVFAGADPVELRREYGQAFSMRGGVDKFAPAKGREAIDRELDHVFPVVQEGGFIPHLDHRLPATPFDHYCYYIEKKKQMLASA